MFRGVMLSAMKRCILDEQHASLVTYGVMRPYLQKIPRPSSLDQTDTCYNQYVFSMGAQCHKGMANYQ
jgi:hypothetical protein